MQDGFRWKIMDEKNRVLFGRRHNDKMVFLRYADMSDEDKDLILSTYALTQEIPETDAENPLLKEMKDYLDFKDKKDDYCG